MIRTEATLWHGHVTTDFALRGEFEGIREQVLEDLLQPLGVGDQIARQIRIDTYDEAEIAVVGHVTEVSFDRIAHRGERNFFGINRDRARLDLREIENVADEVEQVRPRTVDRFGPFNLFRG